MPVCVYHTWDCVPAPVRIIDVCLGDKRNSKLDFIHLTDGNLQNDTKICIPQVILGQVPRHVKDRMDSDSISKGSWSGTQMGLKPVKALVLGHTDGA
jgi:hypothetical protein